MAEYGMDNLTAANDWMNAPHSTGVSTKFIGYQMTCYFEFLIIVKVYYNLSANLF